MASYRVRQNGSFAMVHIHTDRMSIWGDNQVRLSVWNDSLGVTVRSTATRAEAAEMINRIRAKRSSKIERCR